MGAAPLTTHGTQATRGDRSGASARPTTPEYTVLAGTDSAPFGNVATKVEHLIAAGLPAEAAVGAASRTARALVLRGPVAR